MSSQSAVLKRTSRRLMRNLRSINVSRRITPSMAMIAWRRESVSSGASPTRRKWSMTREMHHYCSTFRFWSISSRKGGILTPSLCRTSQRQSRYASRFPTLVGDKAAAHRSRNQRTRLGRDAPRLLATARRAAHVLRRRYRQA